jgi:hypothetical protein
VALAAGDFHTCAMIAGGAVKCWGRGLFGELGNGILADSPTPVGAVGIVGAVALAAGANHTCAVVGGGSVKCWGRNYSGSLGNGNAILSSTPVDVVGVRGATALTAGLEHTCALIAGGAIQCWGGNDYGQLGNGSRVASPLAIDVTGLSGASALAAGLFHACATLAGGTVKCWGYNAYGQLGIGAITQNPTGAWYDPAQDGHGLQVEMLADNRLLAFWYTFDPAGNPSYFVGDGAYDGATAVLTNLRPLGTFFPPNFSTSQVTLSAFGTMTLRFSSCSTGRVDFDLPQGYGRGSMNLTRLTQPAGIHCGSTPATTATGPMAGATGAWFNPAMNGQGIVMESLPGGSLLATWYTYGPSPTGGQAWMTGIGTISGNTATLSMIKPAGGRFIPNFNPALVTRPILGTATMTMSNCGNATVAWDFGQGFGGGSMPLQRLTTPLGVVCREN